MSSSTIVSSSSTPKKPFLEQKKESILAVSTDRAKVIQALEKVNEWINKSKLPKKNYYVIFTGPGKGVCNEWHKASLFIINQKGVIHKMYSMLE